MKLITLFSEHRKWDEEKIKMWEEHRTKGLVCFVIYQGILSWGLISLVIFLILSHQSITLQSENPQLHILGTSLLWLALAVIYGLLTWKHTNASFDAHMSKNNKKAS